MLLLNTKTIKLFNDDFLTVELESETVDIFVCSPPYNLGVNYDGFGDDMTQSEYSAFTSKWLNKTYAIGKPGARLAAVIPIDTHRVTNTSFYADFVLTAKSAGWKYNTTILLDRRREFHYLRWGRTGSFASAAAPQITLPVEAIVVLHKGEWLRSGGISSITKQEFLSWANGVWVLKESRDKSIHPAPFPSEVPRRILKLYSFSHDVVMDPFAGIGTTLKVAAELGRPAIGIEISKGYCEAAIMSLRKDGALGGA